MSGPHLHDPEARQAMLGRLARIEGQVRAIQRMIEHDEGCDRIAQQLSAARKALDRAFYEMVACMIRGSAGAQAGERVPNAEKVAELVSRYA